MLYLTSVAVSFVAVFLKGFQHKNVIAGKYSATFYTSFAMAAFDWATITIVLKGGWIVAITAGTGAAFGMITAMALHDKLFKSKG
jgi:hypothetical protein